MSHDVRQKAVLSSWAKKYVVVEIPPYCRQRGGDDGEEVERRKGGDKEDVSVESSFPMFTSSEADSGEAMDCSSSREEEGERRRGTDACSM